VRADATNVVRWDKKGNEVKYNRMRQDPPRRATCTKASRDICRHSDQRAISRLEKIKEIIDLERAAHKQAEKEARQRAKDEANRTRMFMTQHTASGLTSNSMPSSASAQSTQPDIGNQDLAGKLGQRAPL